MTAFLSQPLPDPNPFTCLPYRVQPDLVELSLFPHLGIENLTVRIHFSGGRVQPTQDRRYLVLLPVHEAWLIEDLLHGYGLHTAIPDQKTRFVFGSALAPIDDETATVYARTYRGACNIYRHRAITWSRQHPSTGDRQMDAFVEQLDRALIL